MALTVTYKNDLLPEGQNMDLGGVLVENGGSVELTREQEDSIVSRVGMSVEDYLKDSEDVEVSGMSFLTSEDVKARFPDPVEVEEEEEPEHETTGTVVNITEPPEGGET